MKIAANANPPVKAVPFRRLHLADMNQSGGNLQVCTEPGKTDKFMAV